MIAFAFALLYAGLSVGTSWINASHNSDTVIQTLISIDHYSPYYWEEKRFGMLVPLLAMPIRDYSLNLLAQVSMIALFGILAVWALARLSTPDEAPEGAILATPLICAGILALFKSGAVLPMLLASPYLPPLCLLMWGLVLITRSDARLPLSVRFAIFGLLAVVSLWVNLSNVVLVGAAIALWPMKGDFGIRSRGIALGILTGATVLTQAFARQYPGQEYRSVLPVDQWPVSLGKLLADAADRNIAAALFVAVLVIGLAVAWTRSHDLKAWSPAGALAVGAVLQIVVASASDWVAKNQFDSRYILSPLLVLAALSLGSIARSLTPGLGKSLGREMSPGISGLLLVAIVTQGFGIPSPSRGIGLVKEVSGRYAAQFDQPIAGNCTHLVGDYWYTWMTMFHDKLTGRNPVRYAVAYRTKIERDGWGVMPEAQRTYCTLCSDPGVEYIRILEKLPVFRQAGDGAGVCKYRTTTAP